MSPDGFLRQMPRMDGQTWIITGAAGGLGRAAARDFLRLGARLWVTARTLDRAQTLAAELRQEFPGSHLHARELDLSRMDSVKRFAESWDGALDGLLHNAGVCFVPRSFTPEGYELKYQTHCLAPMVLNCLLEPCLTGGRVVAVNSVFGAFLPKEDDWRGFGPMSELRRCSISKRILSDAMLTWGQETKDIAAILAHPGFSATPMVSAAPILNPVKGLEKRIFMSPEKACLNLVYAAAMPLASGTQVGPGGFLAAWGWPRESRPGLLASRDFEKYGKRVLADAEKFL